MSGFQLLPTAVFKLCNVNELSQRFPGLEIPVALAAAIVATDIDDCNKVNKAFAFDTALPAVNIMLAVFLLVKSKIPLMGYIYCEL